MTQKEYLVYAFLLAQKANFKLIRPNPFVGAIVVCEKGNIVGEGFHQKAGEAHAEVIAIQNAISNGANLATATLYVTLEPCSHHGKTPPCTDLIIQHKIPHVVIGSLDPNPLVSGIELLEKKGVKITKQLLPEIMELNDVFNINQLKKRPKYIIKTATTLNGKIADRKGQSKWISNEKSRAYVHNNIRSSVDAILSTAKTVIKDNSKLNIRYEDGTVNEINTIIIDRDLDLFKVENQSLAIFHERTNSTLYIVTNTVDTPIVPSYIQFLHIGFMDKVAKLQELHRLLLDKNICNVLIEGGAALNTSFIETNSVDEIITFICPSIITDSDSINVYESNSIQTIENKINLKLLECKIIEEDILLHYKVL